ncbi:segregation/condensation protein A [Deinococcus altitudinis]|uniref:segregation/condensation protein A n=1 Tax=Deinococcus altitudinis TaxID=468914 RepID=UPI003892AA26
MASSDWAFQIEVALEGGEVYRGDLSGLAQRLRAGTVLPAQVPLLRLTRELLAWAGSFAALHPEAVYPEPHAEVLPALAGVIALKAKLLLPAPEPDWSHDDAEDWDDSGTLAPGVLEGVQALEKLELLVQLLSERRQARQGLIPAARLELGLPRRPGKAAGRQGLARLLKAARNAVRDVQVPLLSVERLTLQDALRALRAFARRLSIFSFGAVPVADWAERSTYFSALLEGVKAGDFVVEQLDTYGEIVVARSGTGAHDDAAHEEAAFGEAERV